MNEQNINYKCIMFTIGYNLHKNSPLPFFPFTNESCLHILIAIRAHVLQYNLCH